MVRYPYVGYLASSCSIGSHTEFRQASGRELKMLPNSICKLMKRLGIFLLMQVIFEDLGGARGCTERVVRH